MADNVSKEAFEAYCKAVDAAQASVTAPEQRRAVARLLKVVVEGETIEIRRAAREALIAKLQALYARSANAQAAAVDQFCRDSLGIEPKPMEFSMPYEQAHEIVGYVIKGLVDGEEL